MTATTKTTNAARRQHNYEIGYRHGLAGKPLREDLRSYPGYETGWDHGHCDMPTIEERYPLDYGKEAGSRWYL